MSAPPARTRALGLYRQILRAAITWADTEDDFMDSKERQYIRLEAAKHFRANQRAVGAEQEAALEEGETRLHYARHYGIPYPRLHHTKVRKRFAPKMDFEYTVPHSRDANADSKLAQAAQRIGRVGDLHVFGALALRSPTSAYVNPVQDQKPSQGPSIRSSARSRGKVAAICSQRQRRTDTEEVQGTEMP